MRYVKLVTFVIICALGLAVSTSAISLQDTECPIPISAVRPPYPPIARAKKISGTVLVDVQVNSAGKVVEAKPIMGTELLQTVARQAALEWRFKPFKPFKSVSGTYSVRLTFIFHDAAYVAPEKKPDFTAPYQIELEYPVAHF